MYSRDLVQYAATMVLRNLAKVFWVFPIQKNKIIFTSFVGKQRSCNPLYIEKYLKEYYPGRFEYVWALRDPQKTEGERAVKFLSPRHFYEFCTAKVIIDNGGMPTYMPKRKGQYMINTWHGGGAYKYAGARISKTGCRAKLDRYKSKQTDLFLSSSKAFSAMAIPDIAYQYSGEIMECGMPRNDLFLNGDLRAMREKVCAKLKIDGGKMLVLYAPTFRTVNAENQSFDSDLDFAAVSEALRNRFGREVLIAFRAHNFMRSYHIDTAVDATAYPDMQELLCAADVLISDYSSCIWDFSLLKRPCFLYCPDLEAYAGEDRGVYTPVDTWPGILCRDNEALERAILNFDEQEYEKKVEKHHADLGNRETGRACEQVCRRIAEVCGGR